MLKNPGENDEGQGPIKHGRVGKTSAGKAQSLPVKNMLNSSQDLPTPIEHTDELKFQNQMAVSGICSKKKSADSKPILDPVSLKVSNEGTPASVSDTKDIDKPKIGNLPSRKMIDKYKDASGLSDTSQKKFLEKSVDPHSKSQHGKPTTSSIDDLENKVRSKEKNGIRELPDLNLSEGKSSIPATVGFLVRGWVVAFLLFSCLISICCN